MPALPGIGGSGVQFGRVGRLECLAVDPAAGRPRGEAVVGGVALVEARVVFGQAGTEGCDVVVGVGVEPGSSVGSSVGCIGSTVGEGVAVTGATVGAGVGVACAT